jgi:hypothetical protein
MRPTKLMQLEILRSKTSIMDNLRRLARAFAAPSNRFRFGDRRDLSRRAHSLFVTVRHSRYGVGRNRTVGWPVGSRGSSSLRSRRRALGPEPASGRWPGPPVIVSVLPVPGDRGLLAAVYRVGEIQQPAQDAMVTAKAAAHA